MPASPADHETEFAFIVEGGRNARQVNRSAGPGDATRLLIEKHRELGLLHLRFGDVIGVVEPDREKLRRTLDWRLEFHADKRKPLRRLLRSIACPIERRR